MVKNVGLPEPLVERPGGKPEIVLATDTMTVANAKCDAENARRQRCIRNTAIGGGADAGHELLGDHHRQDPAAASA